MALDKSGRDPRGTGGGAPGCDGEGFGACPRATFVVCEIFALFMP